MFLIDNTIQAEGRDKCFKNNGKTSARVGRKLATNVMKNLRRALEIRAKIGSAAVSETTKAALSTIPR